MEAIQRILCPVDFSEASRRTFEFAEKLALSTNAELIVGHAFDVPAEYTAAGQNFPADPSISARLKEYKPAPALRKCDHVLHAGSPGDVICWLAQDRHCDLIVMGSHGKGGLMTLLFGSVAEYVLRHARCPVLVVRHRRENEASLPEPRVFPPPPLSPT
jgi:universal stress protein A